MTLMRSIIIGGKGLNFREDTPYIIIFCISDVFHGHVLYYIPVIDDISMILSLSLLVPLEMIVAILRIALRFHFTR